jgi:hypothetical protein
MDDIIAVEVRLADGTPRFFVTWGAFKTPLTPSLYAPS